MSFYGYFDTPSVAELRQMAKDSLAKNKDYDPVIFEGNSRSKICKSWWGDAWCRNLDRYADWDNRIDRGRSYLRNGTVIDLKMNGGEIYAKVQGSRETPYTVKITIDPINEKKSRKIEKQAAGKIQNIEALLTGTFPESLKEDFFQEGMLFPSLKEIHFNCSCPDWASLCKHVAATLFGVGVRLDTDPKIFFQMRGINIEDFVEKAISGKLEKMLKNADKITPRIIKDSEIMNLFGV